MRWRALDLAPESLQKTEVIDAVKKDASLKGKAPTKCKECHVKK